VIAVLRRRLRAGNGDDGFTLTELLVTVFVLGILLAGVQTTLIFTQRTVGQQSIRIDQEQQTRLAMEAITKTLRTATWPRSSRGLRRRSSSTRTSTTMPT